MWTGETVGKERMASGPERRGDRGRRDFLEWVMLWAWRERECVRFGSFGEGVVFAMWLAEDWVDGLVGCAVNASVCDGGS